MELVQGLDKIAGFFNLRLTKKDYDVRHCSNYVKKIVDRCAKESMTDPLAMVGLCEATEYVLMAGVKGSFVECGVWRGGSSMAIALTLQEKVSLRDIYMYDTFDGMTPPSELDQRIRDGVPASDLQDEYVEWKADIEIVKNNIISTSYPQKYVHYIKGSVLETLLIEKPTKISLLRLDTDWFDSTYASLVHLYPLLEPGGVLIVDDYNYFSGARIAVEKYFGENNIRMLLTRIGSVCVIGIKA